MTEVITFTGVQGSGKTTMRIMLANHLKKKGYTVINQYEGVHDSISRDAALKGFTLNEDTNFETQYYLACKYMVLDLETRKRAEAENFDYIVLDRSPLDVIPYAMNGHLKIDEKLLIRKMLIDHFTLYPSNLVYCTPLDTIKDDKVRSVNKQFQDEIEKGFIDVLDCIRQFTDPTVLARAPVNDRFKVLILELGL